jgi:hypothetical protein
MNRVRLFLDSSELWRQVATGQSGDRRGPRRGSRAGVLTSPHSKYDKLKPGLTFMKSDRIGASSQ